MIVYAYDPITKFYIGPRSAQIDPISTDREGRTIYLEKPNTTTVAPQEAEEYKIQRWNGSSWDIDVDYRSKNLWDKTTKNPISIGIPGVEIDDSMTDIDPNPDAKYKTWSNEKKNWILDVDAKHNDDVKIELSTSDSSVIRGIEDIIDTLIDKKILSAGDFPANLIAKIERRKQLRSEL